MRNNACNSRYWRRAGGVAVICAGALVGAGCETIGQDLGDVASVFTPIKPPDAARMMMDPYDVDHRRIGTVLISNATFGGADVYVAAYRDMVLNERDPIVRAMAIRALGRHGQPDDAVRIIPNLDHQNVQVRWEAAKALQRLHNSAAVNDLLKVLRNDAEQSDVRVAAAIAVGQYPEDRVVQGLVAALDARELAINIAAEQSLRTLTGQSLGLDSSQWLAWYGAAAASGQAFMGKGEYLYPTYQRDESLLEWLAFWSSRQYEQPAPPAGLRPPSERGTYQEPAPMDEVAQ